MLPRSTTRTRVDRGASGPYGKALWLTSLSRRPRFQVQAGTGVSTHGVRLRNGGGCGFWAGDLANAVRDIRVRRGARPAPPGLVHRGMCRYARAVRRRSARGTSHVRVDHETFHCPATNRLRVHAGTRQGAHNAMDRYTFSAGDASPTPGGAATAGWWRHGRPTASGTSTGAFWARGGYGSLRLTSMGAPCPGRRPVHRHVPRPWNSQPAHERR
jgi:hypothetical protein